MGARFSAPVHTGPGAHPASYTMRTRSLPGVKRPGRGVDHPPHLAPRLKKEYSYTSTTPFVPSWPVLGRPLPLSQLTTQMPVAVLQSSQSLPANYQVLPQPSSSQHFSCSTYTLFTGMRSLTQFSTLRHSSTYLASPKPRDSVPSA